jgi:3-oxoisoapionate decarboxylase
MTRRTLLQSAPVAAAVSAAAPAAGGIKLGYDTYSIRDYRWKSLKLLDYAAEQKLDTIQISSIGEFESLEPAHLQKVKEHSQRLGISIDAGTGCVCPTSAAYRKDTQGEPADYLIKALKVAKAVGSTSVRCFMGSIADRRGALPIEAHMAATVKVFQAVRSQAQDLQVKVALENHGDMQARELRTVIVEAGRDYVGACLDTGNPINCIEDPLVTLEILAPYVITTHFRDTAVWEHPRGAATMWVAMGDGNIDYRKFVAEFRRLCPHSSVQLEIITGRAPQVIPYLEPDFWKAFPKMPSWEFARFVAIAKSGQPFMGNMLIAPLGKNPPVIAEALKEQQKVDLERSLEYAKKKLGLGVRWRG